ncbi:MAG: peptidylprolyl isomerase, partial [Rhodobacteraceae bacterium]|nr:peptidylprolyl isomerase [Paracoccaceae bacterium]
MKKIILVLTFLLLGTINAIAEKERNVLILDVAGENSGTIKIELLHEVAPLHVERIITLTNNGLYDNVAFHRVIEGFMAQT